MSQFEHGFIAYILFQFTWYLGLKKLFYFEEEKEYWQEFIRKYF